jgi:hypothetical protein
MASEFNHNFQPFCSILSSNIFFPTFSLDHLCLSSFQSSGQLSYLFIFSSPLCPFLSFSFSFPFPLLPPAFSPSFFLFFISFYICLLLFLYPNPSFLLFFLNLTLVPYSQSPSVYFTVSVVIPKVCKVVRIEVEYMYQQYIHIYSGYWQRREVQE